MPKVLTIAIFAFVVILLYLNRSYSYFYGFLGKENLRPPVHDLKVDINENTGSKKVYVSLGDSLTDGVGVSNYKESFSYLIAEKLSKKDHIELFNLAHSGAVSNDVIIDQIPKISSINPDYITLLIGVNDIHNQVTESQFEKNYKEIIDELLKKNAKLIVFTIPYLGSDKIVYFPYNYILSYRTQQFNKVINKVTLEKNIQVVDLNQIKLKDDLYSKDQFHPSSKGYLEWAKLVNVN